MPIARDTFSRISMVRHESKYPKSPIVRISNIAHNDVVYDTRFKKMDPSRPMKQCLILEMGMPYINFKTIGDYIILICYYLKLLKVSKTEIKSFIREFEKITREYESSVNPNVSAITIHPDLFSRLGILKNAI